MTEPRKEYLAIRTSARQGLLISYAAIPFAILCGWFSSQFIGAWGILVFLCIGGGLAIWGVVKRAPILGAGSPIASFDKYTMDHPPALKCEKCGTPAVNLWFRVMRDICPNCGNDNRIKYEAPNE